LRRSLGARRRLTGQERGLTVGDVLQVLRHGMVYEPGLPGKSAAQFRYAIQARAPGSGLREVRVVVGLGASATALKIVTVMWADEPMGRS